MRCPKHPEICLFENINKTEGFCFKCQKFYNLKVDFTNTVGREIIKDKYCLNCNNETLILLEESEYCLNCQEYPENIIQFNIK